MVKKFVPIYSYANIGVSRRADGNTGENWGDHVSPRVKNVIVRFLGIVLGATVLGAALGAGVAALRPESYTSTTTVMVTPTKSLPSTQTETVSQYILSNMPTYNNLAMTSSVLQEAADHGKGTDEISKDLTVEVPTGSSLIKLAYTDADKERSAAIADDLAAGLRDSIRQFSPQSDGAPQVDVSIVQKGSSATTSDKPSVSQWALIGGTLGAVLGLAAAQAATRRRAAPRHHTSSATAGQNDALWS
ncbi:hypothetical protein EAE32_10055 [Kocuria tytonicola]|uniref:Polysaccharide chain length determinant N-terminal domain-containing protein n=1 Tax=Kocuria tytonicola TaxID=2055946 RepID=A0A3L9KYT9_9MICC|nr:hypothetical protein EAE32_10055 [Kocuria tytonicola]